MVEYGFDHLHFKSCNVDATAKFFIENFGGKEVFRQEVRGAPIIGVRLAGQDLLIMGNFPDELGLRDSAERRYGLDHFGLFVKDLDVAFKELTAKGVQFDAPPTKGFGLKYAFVTGPDNIRIEIVQRG